VVSAREPAVLANKLGQLMELGVILVLLADLDPGPLLEVAVARLDALLDHVSVELRARAWESVSCQSLVHFLRSAGAHSARGETWRALCKRCDNSAQRALAHAHARMPHRHT